MNIVKKIMDFINKAIVAVACAGMAAITLIICAQVVCRYLLGSPLAWAEELSLYIEVYVVFLAAAYALGSGQHICMDLLISKVPAKVAFILNKLTALVCLIFAIFMTQYCWIFTVSEMGQKMATLPGYKWMIYLALVISSALMVLYSIGNLLRRAPKEQSEEKEDRESC